MSDIRNQLIKDSYNYVLQSDLSTGVVYRIGGDIPVNPIFQSGLTINSGFTYSNGTEQLGYVMTCDAFGNANWAPASAATPSSGVTSITVGNGLSANSSTGAVTIVFTGQTGGDYLPLSGGTVSGNTTFTSGLTVNYIDFDTTPNVPAPTGGTVYFDSNENALSYKPITPSNDVTVNLGQESLIRFYNNLGFQINNGQALHITGATGGLPTVSLAVGTGGNEVQFQVSGIATHDVPDSTFGFMTSFGVVRDINLTAFTVGQQVYLSQTTPGGFDSYSNLSFTGRTCEIGHVLDNSSLGKLQVTILNEIEGTIITAQENNILSANNSSTGVFNFSGLSIDTPSGTTFSVGAVEGWIIDNTTSPANPTIQLIIYSGSSNNTALYVSSATETYILLTSGLTLIQQTTFPTPQQRRQNLYLGKFGHGNRQFLINTFNEPDSALSPVSQLRDMFTAVKLINDGVIASANGPNLNINTSAGILYGLGIGYVTNKLNPNSLTVGGQSPATFQYRTQTGGTATNTTLIDPLNYDVGGVITPLNGVKATNQRIYLLQNGQIRIQYGQEPYNQLAAAIAALQNEVFVTFPNFRDNGILIGVLSILSSCDDLTDTSKAQFFSVSKFGELIGAAGGTSTTTLQQAYNNSSNPEIEINSTLDGLSIKNGTGNPDNTTQLLQGLNSSGTITSFIRADGLISGSTLTTAGFTANTNGLTTTTVSATTYQNLPTDIRTTGATYSNNNFTFTNNTGGTYSVLFDTVTGLTVNGNLTANTISATTYQNLPGSSSSNCFTTFYVTNISGCSPVNIVSPLNIKDGLSVTGTSTFTNQVNFNGGISATTFSAQTYQNLPSFNEVKIDGITQFSGDTNNFINFSGINITITSASTNTLVFSAGTGGVSGNFLPTSGGTIEGNLIVTGNTNVSGVTTSTGNVISLQNLQSLYSVGDEGGEITLAKPATNSTISGTSVTIDIYQNKLRFFESGSPNRGAYIDLTQSSPSAGSDLLSGTSISTGTGISGDTTTGNINLQLSSSSYSMFANNTAVTAAPSEVTYKDTGDASFASYITWTTTTPTPNTGHYRYRWTQVGNTVTFYFIWTIISGGGAGQAPFTITLPPDMPQPATPTGFNVANYVLQRYQFNGNNAAGGTGGTNTLSFASLQRDSGNTQFVLVYNVSTILRWFSITGQYFV